MVREGEEGRGGKERPATAKIEVGKVQLGEVLEVFQYILPWLDISCQLHTGSACGVTSQCLVPRQSLNFMFTC